MEPICPVHQFEIRFSNILNFPIVIRKAIAPFVKFASRIVIDNENSHQERITLFFDEQQFQISITWDRIFIKSESDSYFSLNENNSIIEEPFFNIFSKITDLEEFGEVNNFLFFSIFVNPIEKELDTIISNFTKKYLTENSLSILSDYSDAGIAIEKQKDTSFLFLNFGPYIGLDDIRKKNVDVKNNELIKRLDCVGEMLEYKYFEHNKNISFKKYKEIFENQTEYIIKLWK